jgi:alpha-amylase
MYYVGHSVLVAVLCFLPKALTAAPPEWRGQSIYQIFTDRFARTDSSTTAVCAPGYEGYCGGTWQGIISKLDYIKVLFKRP